MYYGLFKKIKDELAKCLKIESEISSVKNVSGGCINQCFEFVFAEKKFFLKINSIRKFPGMFAAEEKGLRLLTNASPLRVPLPLINGESGDHQYLVLSYLEKSLADENYFSLLGNGLALLHKNSSADFGLDLDNFIGALPQKNSSYLTFTDFFIHNRIEFQLKMAVNSHRLEKKWARNAEVLFSELPAIIPSEKPALLHGDLWSGNVMCTVNGPAVFDPAVYYGHRESDIAMTLLFGGFPASFYNAYENEFPLQKNWKERTEIFNLYPLLVHLNLFGAAYLSQIESCLRKFS
ncbi:MAG: fructosamine kinase family protein [Bacteroidia bacterium]|nr:fructosamine kinase family protein [Bacteroidia bacterium]